MTEDNRQETDTPASSDARQRPVWTTPVVDVFDVATVVKGSHNTRQDGASTTRS